MEEKWVRLFSKATISKNTCCQKPEAVVTNNSELFLRNNYFVLINFSDFQRKRGVIMLFFNNLFKNVFKIETFLNNPPPYYKSGQFVTRYKISVSVTLDLVV